VKIASRIILTSILALSAAVPAFAAEEDTLLERTRPPGQHVTVKHAQTRHATEARAYDPASAPADGMIDFGIGNQR
jgi:hypothetical protein